MSKQALRNIGNRRLTCWKRGFTLMEVVASMAATSLLLAGMASTVYVSSRAHDAQKGPIPGMIEGTRAAQLISSDVQLAQTFNTRLANEVQFTVADRDNNLSPETIRYKWSGVSGEPLTVQYNGGNEVPLVADVQDCQFTYQVQTVSKTTSTTTPGQSGETLLASWNGWPGGPAAIDRIVSASEWSTENFRLTWPANATAVQISRVRVWMKRIVPLANTTVGFYPSLLGTGPLPAFSPLGTVASKANSTLPAAHGPVDFLFNDVTVTDPSIAYNILIKGTGGNNARVQYYNSLSAPVDTPIMKFTTNSGGQWQPTTAAENKNNDLPFEIWGTYDTTVVSNTVTNRYFVRGVGIKLRVGSDAKSQVATSSFVINSPEVATP